MSEYRLKRCPFCGEEPSHIESVGTYALQAWCYCAARGPVIEDADMTYEQRETEAERLWNHRAEPPTETKK